MGRIPATPGLAPGLTPVLPLGYSRGVSVSGTRYCLILQADIPVYILKKNDWKIESNPFQFSPEV